MGIPVLKIRPPWDRLIFNMWIPILVRWHLYIETVPIWMPQIPIVDKSALSLVQVMARSHQATSQYLSQNWTSSMSTYPVNRPQWVEMNCRDLGTWQSKQDQHSTVNSLIKDAPNLKTSMYLVSSCSCLCPIFWDGVLSWEWRCGWSSADRRCSNYTWVINNLIDHKGAAYIRDLTVHPKDYAQQCLPGDMPHYL